MTRDLLRDCENGSHFQNGVRWPCLALAGHSFGKAILRSQELWLLTKWHSLPDATRQLLYKKAVQRISRLERKRKVEQNMMGQREGPREWDPAADPRPMGI